MLSLRPCICFMDGDVRGLAAVGDEIYVIRYNQSHISVYDSDSLREKSNSIIIPNMISPRSLAGCSYNRALYISDHGLKSIRRVDLTNNSVTRWKMKKRPNVSIDIFGLSVTAECTLLATVQISGTLEWSGIMQYTSKGEQLSEIRFDISIQAAWQTVQLFCNQFVVAHGLYSRQRVCLIKSDGQILKSYGLEKRRRDSQLLNPFSISVDHNCKHIFVADHGNSRVIILNADLRELGLAHTPPEFRWPSHIYFDSSSDRLLVDSKESLPSSSCTFKFIEHSTPVTGLTIIFDELFLVRDEQSQVNVYDSYSLSSSRDIDIPALIAPQDLAGCSSKKALYVLDLELRKYRGKIHQPALIAPQDLTGCSSKKALYDLDLELRMYRGKIHQPLACIHRVDLTNNSVACWMMAWDQEPQGISISKENTLLVTVRISNRKGISEIVEYTSEGTLVRVIKFEASIVYPYQTVQLSSKNKLLDDQFIVSHGGGSSWLDYSRHRICKVTSKGLIVKSYGRKQGRVDDQLNMPSSLAIDDSHKRVFVADCHNNRVLILDTDLNYLDRVHIPPLLPAPYRLYFESSTDRLFVGEKYSGRLLVISNPA